jgi:hypothetical protein
LGFATAVTRARTNEYRVSTTVLEHRRSSATMIVAPPRRTSIRMADSSAAQRRPEPVRRDRQSAATPKSRSAPRSSASVANAVLQPERHATSLVWQRQATPSAAASSEANESAFADSRLAAVPANANLSATAIGSQAQARIRQVTQEAQRALLLDSALTERLADDVLRRVDKRLRIERERRGL